MSLLDSNKVHLENVKAGRNVGGRDVYDNSVTTNNFHQPTIYREDKRLKALIEEHEIEICLDTEYKEFSSKLNGYLYRKVEGELRNLEQKLTDAKRKHLIEIALELKENITKEITKNSHFESAQKIYTYLLTQIRITFLSEITAKINSQDFKDYQIDELVIDKIIEPLLNSMEGCSLIIERDELLGLLYVLTGNCYIKWD